MALPIINIHILLVLHSFILHLIGILLNLVQVLAALLLISDFLLFLFFLNLWRLLLDCLHALKVLNILNILNIPKVSHILNVLNILSDFHWKLIYIFRLSDVRHLSRGEHIGHILHSLKISQICFLLVNRLLVRLLEFEPFEILSMELLSFLELQHLVVHFLFVVSPLLLITLL